MLTEAMTAVAAAGGTAIVQAAGTDMWTSVRQRVAGWFGRGNPERIQAELERLDQTARAVTAAEGTDVDRVRDRQEASWETRLLTLLESLDDAEREEAAAQLQAFVQEQAAAQSGGVSAGERGMAVGGNVDVKADGGSIAAAQIHGGAQIGFPQQPDPSQG